MREYKQKTVYHYCSAETFMSIISNATLRACNIRKSNDYTEVINCIDVFMISMRNALKIYGSENKDDVVFHEFIKEKKQKIKDGCICPCEFERYI